MPVIALTTRERPPSRGLVMRLPGATVSPLAPAAAAPGAAAGGRLHEVGSPANEQTARAALRMSPARVALTVRVPAAWATKVARPAASAVAAAPP